MKIEMRNHVLEEQRICSFEEWLQFAVGATYDLDTILANLMTDEIAEEVRLYAIAVAKEALKNASENAEILTSVEYTGGLGVTGLLYENTLGISKESILSENNIPDLK